MCNPQHTPRHMQTLERAALNEISYSQNDKILHLDELYKLINTENRTGEGNTHTCHPRTWVEEAGESGILGHGTVSSRPV